MDDYDPTGYDDVDQEWHTEVWAAEFAAEGEPPF